MAHVDPSQLAFIVDVSMQTKIDPRVIIAWMYQEGAFSGKETGRYNYLNIMGSDHHPVSFHGVSDSISSTVNTLRQPNMKLILNTASSKPSPKQQIQAIAASPWDSGHYGGNGGTYLQDTFKSLFGGDKGLNDSYVGPDQAKIIANTALSGSATGRGIGVGKGKDPIGADPSVVDSAVNTLTSPFSAIEDFFKWIGGNWDRVLYVLGGTILVILAIVWFMKSGTNNKFTFDRGDS